jgi:hypothetical protein
VSTHVRWGILALLCVAVAVPARAGVTLPTSSIEEIAGRQPVGMLSALFGPALPAAELGNSVTFNVGLGGYDVDAIFGVLGGSWHTSRVLPWNAGLAVSVTDVNITTWSIALSSGTEVWQSGRSSLGIEGAVGYQFFVEDSDRFTVIFLGDYESGIGEDVLVDSFRFLHGYVHAVYSLDLSLITPVIDFGIIGTRYGLQANVWDHSFPVTPGEPQSVDGGEISTSLGVGVSLNTQPLILFGGVKGVNEAVFFQGSVGLAF